MSRLSLLPDRLHAAPPLTREEARTLGWEHVERRRKRRGLLVSGLVILGALAALAALVWP